MEVYKTVNGISTKIICHGRSVDDDLSGVEHIVLLIPGNPGVIDLYRDFLHHLYFCIAKENPTTEVPVWGICHQGHEESPISSHKCPLLAENDDKYSLDGQVLHKFNFIKECVPQDVKIIGIGHSIGAKIWSDLLNKLAPRKVAKCIMIHPAIQKLGDTPNAKLLGYAAPALLLLEWFIRLAVYLPLLVRKLIVMAFCTILFFGKPLSDSFVTSVATHMCNRENYRRIIHLFKTELWGVRELDAETLKRNLAKIYFIFGDNDRWVPTPYIDAMRERMPKMESTVCKIRHEFMVSDSKEMADEVKNRVVEHLNGSTQ